MYFVYNLYVCINSYLESQEKRSMKGNRKLKLTIYILYMYIMYMVSLRLKVIEVNILCCACRLMPQQSVKR